MYSQFSIYGFDGPSIIGNEYFSLPRVSIGSIVRVMPGFNTGPVLGLPKLGI
jgi:hypothetical protein